MTDLKRETPNSLCPPTPPPSPFFGITCCAFLGNGIHLGFYIKKSAMNFIRSEMTPPPPSRIFRKFIHFGEDRPPLIGQYFNLSLLLGQYLYLSLLLGQNLSLSLLIGQYLYSSLLLGQYLPLLLLLCKNYNNYMTSSLTWSVSFSIPLTWSKLIFFTITWSELIFIALTL